MGRVQKNTSQKTGYKGERIACSYLIRNQYQIIKQNHHSQFGEIDIIAQKEHTLIFCEVKTYKPNSMVHPLEAITPKKQEKILKTIHHYLDSIQTPNPSIQFDILIIENNTVSDHLQAIELENGDN